MKKLIYFLLAILPVYLQSCVKDEEDVFSKPAAERMQEKLKEYNTILQEATNGWKMEYFPETDQSMGGYTFFCTFAKGEVVMAGDFALKIGSTVINPTGSEVKSTYKLISDQGPVLSFDSYNPIFHFFSEPKGMLDTDGYMGDYEFVFMRQEDDRLIMKGKKYGNTMIMTRIEETPQKELNKILKIQRSIAKMPFDKIDVAGKQYNLKLDLDGRQLFISENENATKSFGFIFTDKGIRFYKTEVINGESLYEFTLDPQTKAFTATNAKATILRTPWIKLLTQPTDIYIFDFNVEQNTYAMNEELFSLIKEAYTKDKTSEGELFALLYIGKNQKENAAGPTCMAFGSLAGNTFYYPSYGCQFTATGENHDLLNISIDYNLNYMMNFYKFFQPIAKYISQYSPYKLEDANASSANSIKCISANNPNIWFELK